MKAGESTELTPDGASDAAETGVQLYQQSGEAQDGQPEELPEAVPAEYTPAEEMPAASESGVEGLGSIFGSFGDFFRGNPGIGLALTAGGAYLLYKATEGGSRGSPAVAGLGSLHAHHRAPPKKKPGSSARVPVYRLH